MSSSSKNDRKYDVFLSFRGCDTQEEFANHLYSVLVAEGVSTLNRKGLGSGEHIRHALEHGIRASRMGILLLSKDFAQCEWCLTELSIMANLPAFRIFPVFYGVSPSDLRDGRELAQNLESRKGRWSNDFIDNSKRVLNRVSRLKGYCVSDFKRPGLIGEFVRDVKSTLRKSPLDSLDISTCFGFDWQVDYLQKLLKVGNHQEKIVKVGIHGMSGIGKTTLALFVCKHISHGFNEVCIVRDVRQRSEAYGLATVQQKMLSDLFEFDSQIDHVQHGKSLIQRRLRERKVLLLLDDIETPEQLEALGGCLTCFGEGSRVLITTTDKQILNVANVDEQHEVRRLQHDHALRLFTSLAFPNSATPDQHMQTVCNEIVSACEGLPIILQVLAKQLVGKRDKRVWTSMIEKLRRHPDLHDRLRICYDNLDGDEKEVFLDIACFLSWTEKETAIIFWKEQKLSAEASLERLCRKSMISFGSGDELLMHSCFRYLGRALESQIDMEPRKRTRLFGDSDPEGVLWRFMEKARTRYICYEPEEEETLNAECFKSLKELQLLWLSNVVIEGHLIDIHLRSLIWLRWRRYSSESLPLGLNLGRLAILQVTEGLITHLWDEPQHQQIRPRRLKVLVLSGCRLLERLPNTLNYKLLQILDLQNCESLKSLPSMAGFKSLVSLNMEGCGVSSLPVDFGELSSLQELNLSSCKNLSFLPEVFGELSSLRELNLSRCKNLSELPVNFGNLSNLEELRIAQNRKLRELPESFGCLKALVYVDAGYCQLSDDGLPVGLSELTMLRVMNLEHNSFSRLPVGLEKLSQLWELHLDGCSELLVLQELPPSLKILDIPHCSSLTKVGSLWDLKQLIRLDATMSDQLVELHGLESLRRLTTLNLMGCEKISTKTLESCLGDLHCLESLFMGGAGITSIQLKIWYDSITKAILLMDDRCDFLCNSDKASSTSRFAEAEGKKGEEILCMDEQNELRCCAGYIVCSVVCVDDERDSNCEGRKRLQYSIEREEQTQVIHSEMRVEDGGGNVLELRIVRVEETNNFEWLRMGNKLRVKATSDYDHWKAYFRFLMHQSPPSTSSNTEVETQPTSITLGM